MTQTTSLNKLESLEALAHRRIINKSRPHVDNAALPAGSPMYYRCLGCGDDIVVSEGWITKPDMCDECHRLVKLGWME
jgi:hypothetical protein